MGPTNVALVRYFQADQQVRTAEARLQAATKDVRVQERKVNDLAEKHRLAAANLQHAQVRAADLELDLKTREAHIEKLRTQQQSATNPKHYQAFLVEINTEKVDKSKIEDEALKAMDSAEKLKGEVASLSALLEQERGKLVQMKAQINDKIVELQNEIDLLRPEREQAGEALPARARDMYDKLADRFEGEGLAAISRPDRRRDEYACEGCFMELAIDVYNKLHSRDEIVCCPSCKRILYIPEDLTPDVAVKQKKGVSPRARTPRASKQAATAGEAASAQPTPDMSFPELPSGYRAALETASKDSTDVAVADGVTSVECGVILDGTLVGYYRGRTVEHLERLIKRRFEDAGLAGDVQVHKRDSVTA